MPPSEKRRPNLLEIAPTRANSVIADIFVLYSDRYAGWLPVAALVELLAEVGVTETNTRATLSRLSKSMMLARDSRDGIAGYRPTGAWGELLPEAKRYLHHRIFDDPPSLADGWLLVSFSFPESARADRQLLRTLLTKEGFGCVSAGLWIFPAGEVDRVVRLIRMMGFQKQVVIFKAQHLAFGPVRDLVARSWDLDAIAASYEEFLAAYDGIDIATADPRSAFTTYTLIHNHLRRLIGRCPALPSEVLPASWPGDRAVEIMRDITRDLREPGERWVDSVVSGKTSPPGRASPKR